MIKIEIKDLQNIIMSLQKIASQDIQVKTAYKFTKLLKQLFVELEKFNSEKIKLYEKYSEKDENNKIKVTEDGSIKIPKKNVEMWQKDMQALINNEFDVDFTPVTINDIRNINLSVNDLFVLDVFIVD